MAAQLAIVLIAVLRSNHQRKRKLFVNIQQRVTQKLPPPSRPQHSMKAAILISLTAFSILLAGCSKKADSTKPSPAPAAARQESQPATNDSAVSEAPPQAPHPVPSPVTQPILAVWQEGNRAEAVKLFVEADWSGRPTFPRSMALNLSEDQFGALQPADHELKARELSAQLDLVKQLVNAVAQAGRDTAAQGNTALAQQCFTSLKQFGAALQDPDHLNVVQVVGRISENMGKNELAKMKR